MRFGFFGPRENKKLQPVPREAVEALPVAESEDAALPPEAIVDIAKPNSSPMYVSWDKENPTSREARHSAVFPTGQISVTEIPSVRTYAPEQPKPAAGEAEEIPLPHIPGLPDVESFDALYAYVDAVRTFEVDGVTYPATILREQIDAFRAGEADTESIPDVPGLRDAVRRLEIASDFKKGLLKPEVVVNEGVENEPIEEVRVLETNESVPEDGITETPTLDAPEEKQFTPPTSFADLSQKKELPLPETTDPKLVTARTLTEVYAYLDTFGLVADQYSSNYMKMIVDRVVSGALSHEAIPQGVPGLREKVYEIVQRKAVNEFLATTPQSVIDTVRQMGSPDTAKWVVSEEPVVAPGGASTEMEEMSTNPDAARAFKTNAVSTPEGVEAAEQYFKERGISLENVDTQPRSFEAAKREEVFADFATKFNIGREDLEKIEGFSSLSTGQLDLVRERFTQLTAKRVERAAKGKHEQFLLSMREQVHSAEHGFLKKMWSGFKESFLSEKRRDDFAKETVLTLREGGIAVHGDVLNILIAKMAAETAPIARHNEETGELEVAYMQPWEGITAEGYGYLKAYNQALFDEGQRTYEKTLRGSHKEVMEDREVEALTQALDKEDVPEALQQSDYHYARRDLMEHMRRERVPEGAILTRIAEADKEMRMEQFIRATPDALRVLEHIEEKNTWLEVAKSVAVERGVYGAASVLMGMVSAPLAAVLVGGIRAWTRTKAEMREIDRGQRTGSVSTSDLAFAVSDAAGVKTPESMFGIINKVSWAVERLTRLDDEIARIEQGEKSGEAKERLSNLIEKREKVLVSLKNRVEHTEDKLRLGRINFGSTDAFSQQYALMEQLTRAQALLADVVGNSEVREKVDALISKSDASVLSARRAYMRKNVLKGAVIAGAAAGLGALIGEMFTGGKSVVEGRVGGREFGGGIREAVSSSTITAETVAPNGAPVADVAREVLQQAAPPEIVERVVKSDDTVIEIFRTEIPAITKIQQPREQETVIANFIKALTSDELKAVGVGSGKADEIHIGETLDIGKLEELFAAKMTK